MEYRSECDKERATMCRVSLAWRTNSSAQLIGGAYWRLPFIGKTYTLKTFTQDLSKDFFRQLSANDNVGGKLAESFESRPWGCGWPTT